MCNPSEMINVLFKSNLTSLRLNPVRYAGWGSGALRSTRRLEEETVELRPRAGEPQLNLPPDQRR